MQKFAFIIHPIDAKRDVSRKYPVARYLPESLIEWYLKGRDPIIASTITGIRSSTGEEAAGWFIVCPFTPRQFLTLPLDFVYDKLEKCGHIAEELGAGIVGLGAFTSVVGDGGITLARRLKIAVTTGNSYTICTAVEGAKKGAELMGIRLPEACVAVIGATGSIGATCAELMARSAREVRLIGRNMEKLKALEQRLSRSAQSGGDSPTCTISKISSYTDIPSGLLDADIIITVSSAAEAIVHPSHIKRGAVVCDVARPRDVSVAVAKERPDVLVIEGGVVKVPGEMRCNKPDTGAPFSFGFPPGAAYACMSETIALALEGRYESFTLGKEVSIKKTDEIGEICSRHGFKLDGFRSFEHAVTDEEIERIRNAAGR